jgi:predicted dehydrogenase
MSDKVRLGIIGTGGMGQGHCSQTPDLEEAELTCICDIDPETCKSVSEKYSVKGFTNYKELIDSGLAEAVIVATPHYFHPPIGVYAFRAGLHVLSEKPIAVTIGAAEELVSAAKESGKVFTVMFQFRAEPYFRKAQEIIASGELGEIYRTLLIYTDFRTQTYYNSAEWRATWVGEGGGVLINQAPHALDQFVALGGLPHEVLGFTRTRVHDIEVEDSAFAICRYENGAHGYLTASTDEYPGTFFHEIAGEKGKLVYRDKKLYFARVTPDVSECARTNPEPWGGPKAEMKEVELTPCETGHRAVIRNFLRTILGKEELLIDGSVGTGSLELSNAIYLSAYQNRKVHIPLDREEIDEFFADLRAKSVPKSGVKKIIQTDPQHKRET